MPDDKGLRLLLLSGELFSPVHVFAIADLKYIDTNLFIIDVCQEPPVPDAIAPLVIARARQRVAQSAGILAALKILVHP